MLKEKFNAVSATTDPDRDVLIEAIRAERTDLKDKIFYQASYDQGNNAYTFFVGNEVIKTPLLKAYQIVDNFDREIGILQALAGKGLPVPEITYVGQATSFFTMARMEGIPGSWPLIGQMTDHQKELLAGDIATFKVSLENETRTSEPPYPSKGDERYINLLYSVLHQPRLQDRLVEGFDVLTPMEKYFNHVACRETVLAHNDLHGLNLMLDPQSLRLSAVLDFGLADYTLFPEKEFVDISSAYNDAFCDKFKSAYLELQTKIRPEHMQCYRVSRLMMYLVDDSRIDEISNENIDVFKKSAVRLLQAGGMKP